MTGNTQAAVLDVAGAAQFMGTTEKAIRQKIARKQFPYRKLAGRIVFIRTELEQFLETCEGCTLAQARKTLEDREMRGEPTS